MNVGSSSGTNGRSYTPEQVALCKRILSTKNYYAILGVSQSATTDEIKKAYKKLAIQLHPDKNSAPQAEDAFKSVAKANACLSDSDKRRIYDHTGQEDGQPQPTYQRQPHTRAYGQHGHQPEFFNAADLLHEFLFGGSFGGGARGGFHFQGGRPQPQRRPQQGQGGQEGEWSSLVNFIPMLIFFFIYLWSSLFSGSSSASSSPAMSDFSLNRNSSFPVPRKTQRVGVDYYVGRDFKSRVNDASSLMKKFEENVEIEYLLKTMGDCEVEKSRKNEKMKDARANYKFDELKHIYDIATPSCERVKELKRTYPHLQDVSLSSLHSRDPKRKSRF